MLAVFRGVPLSRSKKNLKCLQAIKFRNFVWKSNGTVIFREICSRNYRLLLFSFVTERRKFLKLFATFSRFQSLSTWKPIAGNRIANNKRHSHWVGLLILEKLLPLFNVHLNQLILTNDKHPLAFEKRLVAFHAIKEFWSKFQKFSNDEWNRIFRNFRKGDNLGRCIQIFG